VSDCCEAVRRELGGSLFGVGEQVDSWDGAHISQGHGAYIAEFGDGGEVEVMGAWGGRLAGGDVAQFAVGWRWGGG
jgi:hypothetical protein